VRWVVLWTILIAIVLVPFLLFEKQFEQLATWLAQGNASGWATAAAIGALLALDVFLPVPSSIVSTGAGVLLGFWPGAAVIWIGMSLGCLSGYIFGAYAAVPARRLVGADGLSRAGKVMDQYGPWAIVICRPIPVLAESSIVFAGLVRSPLGPFLWLTALADLGISIAYAAVGAFSMQAGSFLLTFAGAVALPGLAMLAGKLWLGRRSAAGQADDARLPGPKC
jgi:uncharacterized membrane protein YdjX (TVP38/TMEM64 family)